MGAVAGFVAGYFEARARRDAMRAEHNDADDPRFAVAVERVDGEVRIDVRDNGPGVGDVPDQVEGGDLASSRRSRALRRRRRGDHQRAPRVGVHRTAATSVPRVVVRCLALGGRPASVALFDGRFEFELLA